MTSASIERELIVVTGKGGVGKSTVTAALAQAIAGRGRRVLALEIDPRESLHRLFGTDPSGGAVIEAVPGVWHQNLRPREEIEALVRRRLPVPRLAGAVAASPVFRHFVDGAPGLKELAALGHAFRLVAGEAGPGVDTVVLDAPATGHGVSLLAAPLLVAEVLEGGPVASLARQLADLVADGARCGVAVVTQAEEMPVQETLELAAALRERVGRGPDLVIVNGLWPPRREGDESSHLWARRRDLNERELARLRRGWTGRTLELPLLPLDGGPALARALAERLAAA